MYTSLSLYLHIYTTLNLHMYTPHSLSLFNNTPPSLSNTTLAPCCSTPEPMHKCTKSGLCVVCPDCGSLCVALCACCCRSRLETRQGFKLLWFHFGFLALLVFSIFTGNHISEEHPENREHTFCSHLIRSIECTHLTHSVLLALVLTRALCLFCSG